MESFISVSNCWVLKVLGPAGEVLTSEGKGDLGPAQVEFPGGLDQHLEPDDLKAAHAVQTICSFWICRGALPHPE